MILKPFEMYELTLGLKALKKRLPSKHEKFQQINDDLNKQEAGDLAEKKVMDKLTSSQLPKNHVVLHNVSFISKVETQIDVLVISPSWCLIMEVKNWNGSLFFSDHPSQVVCQKDGIERVYTNPESQIEQYMFGLNSLFEAYRIKIPIYGLIVFPFNNAAIKKPPTKFPVKVGNEYLRYLWSLQINKNYADPLKLGEILISRHEQWNKFPLCDYYGIDKMHIVEGVECPQCGTIPMQRMTRTWYCTHCDRFSMKAHEKALKDYGMLISNTISMQETLRFLRLRNRYEAKRMIQANSIGRIGARKSTTYVLSDNNKKRQAPSIASNRPQMEASALNRE
ncbi:nuclease-related domain-containing protein [Lysinibacillus antri]|uniref:NERD domain-containing protein n=1 Tax=Lysinibacillus antri TaxID=2498145 RepID=A0A432LD95_9BACI|nr:nuclease-related domain-containing protein [Lysinibacillus antri]RUL53198.1 NERD domain-containing protein [Lysinibacillus antri]